MADLAQFLVPRDASVQQVMQCIDRNAKGIALVVDDLGRLLGTITDGDIRRALLAGDVIDLADPAMRLLARPASSPYPVPLTAPLGTPDAQLLLLMMRHAVRHLPIVDEQRRVVDVVLFGSLVEDYEVPIRAVVMAGGYGKRLRPLTDDRPKPMLDLGNGPLLERIVGSLRDAGIRRIHLTTHYLAEKIAGHFGDGHSFGVDIRYVEEHRPLGTAGALSLVEPPVEPVLVMNGDILTGIDFRALIAFHTEHRAVMTVAVLPFEATIPYGVIQTDGVLITGIAEKPVVRRFVAAGIYLINPEAARKIPVGQPYDMPTLIARLVADGDRVVSFPIREYWLDIGRPEDYEQAVADVASGRI